MSDTAADPVVGVVAATQSGAAPLTVFAAPATGEEFNTLGERLVPKGCFKVEDLLFDFDSSFIRPDMGKHLPKLAQLRNDNKIKDPATGADLFPSLSIFGHADPVGDDLNKTLSGRRALAFYSLLVRDVDAWEKLFENPFKGDDWGVRSIQTILSAVQEPITVNGVVGDETRAAVKKFQKNNGLQVDGVAGKGTRKILFAAYMDLLCGPDLKLDKTKDFLARNQDGGGKGDFQGCSEFNPLRVFSKSESASFEKAADKTRRNQDNAPNRRVMVLLFAPGRKVNPAAWPCPRASEGPAACKKRFFPDADTRRNPQSSRREFEDTGDTFACRFYQIISDDSPCERVKPAPPQPVVIGVNPLILFALAGDTVAAAGTATAQSFVNAPAAPSTVGAVTPLKDIVLVKKPYTHPQRVEVVLKTDKPFDGEGVLSVNDPNAILLFPTAFSKDPLKFNNIDNKFRGAQLDPAGPGVHLFAEGKSASPSMGAFVMTLHLSGGTKKPGPDAIGRLTAIELTLDICAPRVNATTAPVPLPQAPQTPAANPTDKFFLGRPVPIQDEAKIQERAMLMVQPVKTSGFAALNRKLVLVRIGANIKTLTQETPSNSDVEVAARHTLFSTNTPTTFFVEGVTASATARDNSYQLGIDGLDGDGDRVSISVVHAEIVSNRSKADVHAVAIVPEKPARTTRSIFLPAPLIVGRDFPVELRSFVLLASATRFQWTVQGGATLRLTDTDKLVLKLTATGLSTTLNDTLIQVLLTTEMGQFVRRHRLTAVHVTIDPVLNGENIAQTDPINKIRNPAGLVILTGADAADANRVAKVEMLRFPARPNARAVVAPVLGIEPNLAWTDDDDRIAWWIVGDDGKDLKGKADFRNAEAAKRGTKIEVFGTQAGDVLIQPYSGGFGYGMFRTNVVNLRQIKFRVNRIFTDAVPARPGRRGIPARVPTQRLADAQRHIDVANIYLRQAGIELIPDNSNQTASRAGNPQIGLASLDRRVVSVTPGNAGFFDVKVDDQTMTFNAVVLSDALRAIRVNARNEVVVFAYVHSVVSDTPALAITVANPLNHAPKPRSVPPQASARFLKDKGVPSSSLIRKTGIPPDVPVSEVRMTLLDQLSVNFKGGSSPTRDVNLQWGIIVPTTSIDTNATRSAVASDLAYGSTLAHELGHVLGLAHRGRLADEITDHLATPQFDNVMSGNTDFLRNENLDIVQVKAMRFSEVFFHNP